MLWKIEARVKKAGNKIPTFETLEVRAGPKCSDAIKAARKMLGRKNKLLSCISFEFSKEK